MIPPFDPLLHEQSMSEINALPEAGDAEVEAKRRAVVHAIRHAWKGYADHAFGQDEVRPLSGKTNNWIGLGLTILDSLDVLFLAGLTSEYERAVAWVHSSLSFDRRKSRHQPTPLPSDLTSSGSGSSSNGSAAPGSGSSSRSGTPPASLPQGLAGLSPLRGTLSKRCHTTKRWVSRFIEVDDQRGLLLYYSTSSTTPSSMPSRVYLLCELESVQPLSLANKWAFEVVFVGGTKGQQRKLLCNCESEEVEVRWVKGLETRLAWRESFYARPRCAQRVHSERPVGMHLGLTGRGAAGSLRFGVEVAGASAGDLAAGAGVGVGDLILSVRDTVVSEPRGAVALLDDSGPSAAAPGAPAKIDFVILMKQRGGGAAAGAEGAGEGGGEEGGGLGSGGVPGGDGDGRHAVSGGRGAGLRARGWGEDCSSRLYL